MTKHVIENPPHFREMSSVMLEGIACIDFTTDVESSLAFCHKLHGVPCELIIMLILFINFSFHFFYLLMMALFLDEKLTFFSWLNLKYHEMIFFFCSEYTLHINVL